MRALRTDQAEGLRRLAGERGLRIVPLVSARPGVGKTAIVANVASALARSGRRVLVFDEDAGLGNVNDRLGLRARYDLAHVLRGVKRLDEVLLTTADGVHVLPAARGMAMLPGLGAAAGEPLLACFERVAQAFDGLLIDAAPGAASRLVAAGMPSQDVTLVLSGGAASMLETYGLIKRTSVEWGSRRFQAIVSKARSAGTGVAAFHNLAETARRYVGVELRLAGAVPHDASLQRANALCRTVLDMFPESPAAGALRAAAENLLREPGPARAGEGIERFVDRLTSMSRLELAGPVI